MSQCVNEVQKEKGNLYKMNLSLFEIKIQEMRNPPFGEKSIIIFCDFLVHIKYEF